MLRMVAYRITSAWGTSGDAMTDWNAYLNERINRDPARERFEERLPTISPELNAAVEELRQIERNVATVEMLAGKYETYWQLPNGGSSTFKLARLHFIKAKRYPLHIPDFIVGFSYMLGEGLTHEKDRDFQQREPTTVQEATKIAIDELSYLL